MTQLLQDWGNGDRAALDLLVPVVYQELRRLASYYMSRERPGHTLQTSALVNEAYMSRYFARHGATRVEGGESLALSRDQGGKGR